jgi:hypothetical protein
VSAATECVLWTGARHIQGYGQTGKDELAHRQAWTDAFGPIPSGMQIHHECGVKLCVNVNHMQLLTTREHARLHGLENGLPLALIALNAARRTQTHCKHGHEFTEANTYWTTRGWRQCKRCRADRALRYYHAHHVASRPMPDVKSSEATPPSKGTEGR